MKGPPYPSPRPERNFASRPAPRGETAELVFESPDGVTLAVEGRRVRVVSWGAVSADQADERALELGQQIRSARPTERLSAR